MDPTPDAFAALARSSPWRWSRLHWRYRSQRWPDVEAWVVRPGWQLVRPAGHQDEVETGVPYSRGSVTVFVPEPGEVLPPTLPTPPPEPEPVAPGDVVPTYRDDGLVAVRPSALAIHYDDPLFASAGFTWVAMLDPVELSHDVEVDDVVAADRAGRETWWATLRAQEGYQARCEDCCDLLMGGAAERCPYRVGLDVQTGIVVSLHAEDEEHRRSWLENDILAVDDAVVVPDGHVPRAVRGSRAG